MKFERGVNMAFFTEISDYSTYSGQDADFHFIYNSNSGGGQAFLGGKFFDSAGQLVSPEILNGKIATFVISYRTDNGEERSVILNDENTKYKIKPRGSGSTSMKLGIGDDHIAPSRVISAFMMLPITCGVKKASDLHLSILSAKNYWLQSMWLKCNTNTGTPNEVQLIVNDCVFGGGIGAESTDTSGRYFKLNIEQRMRCMIEVSQKTHIFGEPITSAIQLFADIYMGTRSFQYEECNQAVQTIMQSLAQKYPERYTGISDPLPVICELISEEVLEETQKTDSIREKMKFHTGYQSTFARNRIVFGAPGTGKSYTLNREKDELLANGGEYERVTFHPDYSYANFVGTYKPVPCKDSDGKDAITYSYVPGPFMRIYVKALKNSRTDTPKPFLLVIEEINRANMAGVFGDIFQLLDRSDSEISEYPIQASEDIKKFLALPENLGGSPEDYAEICIPDNMFIWATMNSADQGVFPMDTAFKRRWNFTYLGIDDNEAGIIGKKVILGKGKYCRIVEWNELRKAINEELIAYKVNEDKLMGPYFISKKNIPQGELFDPETFASIFKNKVLMYLFDDAAKQKRPSLFAGCEERSRFQYSKICREFDMKGVSIFCEKISNQFIDMPGDDAE